MESDGKDVSRYQDFIFYLQNMTALEHHAIESYSQNKDPIQLQISQKARRERSKWLYRFVKESKDQIYCESKHLASIACSLKEMGNRFMETKEIKLAEECFDESQKWEALIILLNEEGGKHV